VKHTKPLIVRLKEIKAFSDKRDYVQKDNLLRQLMMERPTEFKVEHPNHKYPGVVHKPTNFRFHLKRKFIPYGIKTAELEGLKPFQQRAVKRILEPKQEGLVLAHGTGSGKTRESIEAYKRLNLPTNVVLPAALRANYEKELKKWIGGTPANLSIESQQAVARRGLQSDKPGGLTIVDEAHRAREGTSQLIAALKETEAKKRLALTATPIFNHPKDMSSVVNFVAGKNVLPESKPKFDEQYVGYNQVNPGIFQRLLGIKPGIVPELKNRDQLKQILNKYIDYYPGSTEGFPSSKEEAIKVQMTPKQMEIYKAIMGKAPWWVRWKVKSGLPPGRGELDHMKAFLSGARQVSNTTQGFVKDPQQVEGAKIQKAFDYLRKNVASNPRYKGIVYSNYLNSGLNPYKSLLEKANIPYGEFSGDISPKIRNQMVKDYNANKLRALLISSAGSEGLDLKGTRLIQLLEPHFNEEKEKQIIGRGIRYRSHDALPDDEKNVLIQRYLASPQAGWFSRLMGNKEIKGADEYIRNIALQKSLLTNQITDLLNEQNKGLDKQSSEKQISKHLNIKSRTPSDLYKLLNATSLASARIRAGNALQGAKALNDAGWTTPEKMLNTTWEQRVHVLNRNGYARYDESRARFLEHNAKLVKDKYRGDLRKLTNNTTPKIKELIQEFKGIGPVGANIFVRELKKLSSIKPGPLFNDKPDFESTAPHNTYNIDYKGKNIARIYHKIRTKHPSGIYIEPNYSNKRHSVPLIMKLLLKNKNLVKNISVKPIDAPHITGFHKGLQITDMLK
jgi:hypothetical protein